MLIGLLLCRNAWLAILLYHGQILFWRRQSRCRWHRPAWTRRHGWMLLPSILVAPIVWQLIPIVTRMDLSQWLLAIGLPRPAFWALVPYFAVVHPVLEQIHWSPLRRRTPWAHGCFAGYHLLVLRELLTPGWLVVTFGVLVVASWLWKQVEKRDRSLWLPVLLHTCCDAQIIGAAAWLMAYH